MPTGSPRPREGAQLTVVHVLAPHRLPEPGALVVELGNPLLEGCKLQHSRKWTVSGRTHASTGRLGLVVTQHHECAHSPHQGCCRVL